MSKVFSKTIDMSFLKRMLIEKIIISTIKIYALK